VYAARINAPSYVLETVGAILETFCDCTLIFFWLAYLDRLGRVRAVPSGARGRVGPPSVGLHSALTRTRMGMGWAGRGVQRAGAAPFKQLYLPKIIVVGAYAILQLGVSIWLRCGCRLRACVLKGGGGGTDRWPLFAHTGVAVDRRTLNIYQPTLNNASLYDYALFVRRPAWWARHVA
jgi:hypothetical protein